jgi:hypothetical protein
MSSLLGPLERVNLNHWAMDCVQNSVILNVIRQRQKPFGL